MKNYEYLFTNLHCYNNIEYKIINNTILVKTDIEIETNHNLYLVLHINRFTHRISKIKQLVMTPQQFDIYGCKIIDKGGVHVVTKDDIKVN